MRKIDVTEYTVKQGGEELPYPVRDAMVDCLFAPNLKVKARDLFKRDDLARKIEAADGFVLLEDAEYEMLKAGIDSIEGFTRNDIELVRRIHNAEKVEVKVAE